MSMSKTRSGGAGGSAGGMDRHMELFNKALDETASLLLQHLPTVQHVSMQILETIFVPRVIAQQLMLLVALEAGLLTWQQVSRVLGHVLGNYSSRSRLIRQLLLEQANACTQDEWMDLAERIDSIQHNDVWRSTPECPLYEKSRISARIDEFVHLLRRRDVFELMFVLRGGIARNKFGLLHEGLFSKAMAGTKVLVETYHNVVCNALDFVCDAPTPAGDDFIPTDARLAFFNETRHSYGRTALLLSGGAALGFYHVGVVKTLMENNLMPRVIGGSSAGSILCSMIGTRTDDECVHDLFEAHGTQAPGHSGELRLNFFRPLHAYNNDDTQRRPKYHGPGGIAQVYYNTAGAFHDAKRTIVGFMPIPVRRATSFIYDIVTGHRRPSDVFKSDTVHFRECVRACVGNFTFQEAFDRTGRILNIVVTPNNASDPPRLLNYLTAPHVLVWSAAVASSSLPGVFEANRLVVKEADGWERYESAESQQFSDGSMEQDLPMQQLSEMFNTNHFIVSQANPHAVMFASYNQKNSGVWTSPLTGLVSSVINFLRNQLRSWLMHLVQCIGARRIAPAFETQRGIGTSFFTQEYEGRTTDISLIPWLGHRSLLSALLHIIYNPSEAEFREWVQAAERETWKYIPAIKSHIAEEITLDRCVQRLRQRLVQESWEKQMAGTAEDHLGSRVPSFFNSPSLVNLGGLGVSDQPNIEGLHKIKSPSPALSPQPANTVDISSIDINSGWGGMGLRGNRSSGNLQRAASEASGLFIDDEDGSTKQDAGERAGTEQLPPAARAESSGRRGSISKQADDTTKKGYIKTTSMARFYYRKVNSAGQDLATMGKTKSDPVLESLPPSDSEGSGDEEGASSRHARRKSQSHGDLLNSAGGGDDDDTESSVQWMPLKD